MKKIRFYIYCLISLLVMSFKPVLAENWEGVAACNLGPSLYSDEFISLNKNFYSFLSENKKNLLLNPEENKALYINIANSYKEVIGAYNKTFFLNTLKKENFFNLLKNRDDDVYSLKTCAAYLGLDNKLPDDFAKLTQKFLIENIHATDIIFDEIVKAKKESSNLNKFNTFIKLIKSNNEVYEILKQSKYKEVFDYTEYKEILPIINSENRCLKDHAPIAINQYSIASVYPQLAAEKSIGGKATIEVIVDKEGNALNAKITSYSNEAFNANSLLSEAYKIKFIPAFKECQTIEHMYSFNVVFPKF